MYALADACLVTSTRDGMNLVSPAADHRLLSIWSAMGATADSQVAYEYISSQVDRHGAMILSEFAGAAQSLNGSLLINPCESATGPQEKIIIDTQGTCNQLRMLSTPP